MFADALNNWKQKQTLLPLLGSKGTFERGGLLMHDGEIVELANTATDPESGFQPDPFEVIRHLEGAVGTWHTHPGASSNLSVEDAQTFTQWPEFFHAIIGTDGVRWYGTKAGAAVNV